MAPAPPLRTFVAMSSRVLANVNAEAGQRPADAPGSFVVENRPAAPVQPATSGGDAARALNIEAAAREALMSSPLPSVRTSSPLRADRPRSMAAPVQPAWSPLEATLEVLGRPLEDAHRLAAVLGRAPVLRADALHAAGSPRRRSGMRSRRWRGTGSFARRCVSAGAPAGGVRAHALRRDAQADRGRDVRMGAAARPHASDRRRTA